MSAAELAAAANGRTYCACFFGGDPASQMPHALAAGGQLAERGVVVFWETASTANPRLLDRALELSLGSGGCIKFALKAFNENLHQALTGGSNVRTLENFARAAARIGERPEPPPLIASTLLVPGYVDAQEVGRIATFIAELNPAIPYALLALHPHFETPDLPRTSLRHGQAALTAAREAGLQNMRLGNVHLLSDACWQSVPEATHCVEAWAIIAERRSHTLHECAVQGMSQAGLERKCRKRIFALSPLRIRAARIATSRHDC